LTTSVSRMREQTQSSNSRIRGNSARAISGFGNSEGGIIVWGVDCRSDPQRGDVPTNKHPIRNVKRFLSYLEGAVSGCTVPPHDGVRNHVIERPRSDEGFVVTLIPKSMFAPLQCIVGRHRSRYHVRVGSNFEQAPHGLLAGMFVKAPTPYIFHMWGLGGKISPASYAPAVSPLPTSTPYVSGRLILRNGGQALARDLYVNYSFMLPGPECMVHNPNPQDWALSKSILDGHHLVSAQGYRLPPGGMVSPVEFRIFLKPPFERHLWYEFSFGCAGSQVSRVVKTVSITDLTNAYAGFAGSDHGPDSGKRFAQVVFAVNDESEYLEAFD
jgi:hypothetical protein